MRLLRFLKTFFLAALGNHAARVRLRREVFLLKAIDAVMLPYRKGDYQTALQASESFREEGEVSDNYCFYRAACLMQLDRLTEAEYWFRRCVAMREACAGAGGNAPRHLAIAYTSLGELLLQTGRGDEAVECFESSIRHFPERSSGPRHMAEAILHRGGDPAEALRWASVAVEKANADTAMPLEFRKLALGESLATRAWAIAAVSHNSAEVARLTAEAVETVGVKSLASAAEVHYHAGLACQEAGDHAHSERHFAEAGRLDTQGKWGRAARAALAAEPAPNL